MHNMKLQDNYAKKHLPQEIIDETFINSCTKYLA